MKKRLQDTWSPEVGTRERMQCVANEWEKMAPEGTERDPYEGEAAQNRKDYTSNLRLDDELSGEAEVPQLPRHKRE